MMTIEEKARAYDEAIEKAKDYHKQLLDEDNPEWASKIENIFPKLKESREDEIIRVIKEVILNSVPYKINILTKDTTITAEEAIAWLEKQGEKTSDKIVEKARTEKQRVLLTETDGSANIDWDCRSLDDVKSLLKCGLEFIRTIEANKQILTDSRFGGHSFRVPTRYDKGIKQGEQILAKLARMNIPPTDKVEPKFKVGDKIRRKTPSSCDKDMQVSRICNDHYICNHIGKFSSKTIPFSEEWCYELIEQKSACKEGDEEVSSSPMVYTRLQMFRSSIDTLEGKEVDLEKELSKVWKDWANEYAISFVSYKEIAKHFFEYGLKAQKGE